MDFDGVKSHGVCFGGIATTFGVAVECVSCSMSTFVGVTLFFATFVAVEVRHFIVASTFASFFDTPLNNWEWNLSVHVEAVALALKIALVVELFALSLVVLAGLDFPFETQAASVIQN